jgi:serine/threonine protein kinase
VLRPLVGRPCHNGGETLDPPATDPTATLDPQPRSIDGSAITLPTQFGRFQIRDFLGEGSFGAVYRAFDPQLDREVALKVAKPGAVSPKRFRAEVRASAGLRHPNIVPLYEAGESDGQLYFASAFVAGMTLEDTLHEREGGFSPREAAEIARKLSDALAGRWRS